MAEGAENEAVSFSPLTRREHEFTNDGTANKQSPAFDSSV